MNKQLVSSKWVRVVLPRIPIKGHQHANHGDLPKFSLHLIKIRKTADRSTWVPFNVESKGNSRYRPCLWLNDGCVSLQKEHAPWIRLLCCYHFFCFILSFVGRFTVIGFWRHKGFHTIAHPSLFFYTSKWTYILCMTKHPSNTFTLNDDQIVKFPRSKIQARGFGSWLVNKLEYEQNVWLFINKKKSKKMSTSESMKL